MIVFVGLLCSDRPTFAQSVVATIPVGVFPFGVAVNRVTDRVYVANLVGQPISPFLEAPNTVSVIDGASNRVIDDIVTGLDFQIGLGVDDSRDRVYVATLDNGVDVLSGRNDSVIANIPVDGEPVFSGVNPFTKSVYVSNQRGWVTLLDEDENNIVATIELTDADSDGEPEGVAVDPITNQINQIYVANLDQEGSVWVIDGRTNNAVSTIPVGDSSHGIAVNPFTRRVYVANSCRETLSSSCPNTVSVISERTNRVITAVQVGGTPVVVAVDELRNLIYTGNTRPGGVSIINGQNNKLLATVPLDDPHSLCNGLAVNTLTNRVYCTNPDADTVTVINGPERRGRRRHG
jgi:YVTN family beta-propeller protein